MLKPRALKIGDTIGIAAPASHVDRVVFLKGVSELEAAGYRVRYSEHVLSKNLYFAGPHRERAADFMSLFTDPAVDAVFCARGGYGCHYLLQHLDATILRTHPKIFVGYSDVSVLLQFLENQCGMVTFHGPMVAREFALGEPSYDLQNLLRCVSSPLAGYRISHPSVETLQPGIATGKLTGGCLSLLTALLGTSYEIQTAGRILFLEDVNAKPYQVDRMLMHLNLAGKLKDVHGIIFGEMLDCVQSPDQEYRLQDVVTGALKGLNVPILFGLPSGHTTTGSLTLPFGVQVTLNADERYLQLEEGAVD